MSVAHVSLAAIAFDEEADYQMTCRLGAGIQTSHSCPFECNFCASPYIGGANSATNHHNQSLSRHNCFMTTVTGISTCLTTTSRAIVKEPVSCSKC